MDHDAVDWTRHFFASLKQVEDRTPPEEKTCLRGHGPNRSSEGLEHCLIACSVMDIACWIFMVAIVIGSFKNAMKELYTAHGGKQCVMIVLEGHKMGKENERCWDWLPAKRAKPKIKLAHFHCSGCSSSLPQRKSDHRIAACKSSITRHNHQSSSLPNPVASQQR